MATNRKEIKNEVFTTTVSVGQWKLKKRDGHWYGPDGEKLKSMDIIEYMSDAVDRLQERINELEELSNE